MLKLIAVIALFAAPAALAAAQPDAVTIAAAPQVVTFGDSTELSGVVTPRAATEISVAGQTCASAPRQDRNGPPITLETNADGAWSTTVTPLVRTTYLARAGGADSTPLTVQVRPRLTLTRTARHKFHVHLAAAMSFDGKIGLFQRFTPFGWKTVKSVVLHWSDSASDAVTADRTFSSGIAAREVVRILIPPGQTGDCYASASSNTIRS